MRLEAGRDGGLVVAVLDLDRQGLARWRAAASQLTSAELDPAR